MILAQRSGSICDVKLIRETRNAWFIEYQSEPGVQYRKPKDQYGLFDNRDAAREWQGYGEDECND